MKIINNNICAPKGFLASSIYSGVRKNPHKSDLAVIYSKKPAIAAGVFTTNLVKAAPVLLTQEHLKKGKLQAIVVNSGNANACTGPLGMQHAQQMAAVAANELKIFSHQIAVASTGIIGVPLPIEKVVSALPAAVARLSTEGGDSAASAIMTTDTFAKSIAIEIEISGTPVRLGAIAKGSGMIHPNMATMLAFITTDACISKTALQKAVKLANQETFNMISVDGDTSTNDMVIALANGMAKNIKIDNLAHVAGKQFYQALRTIFVFLAKEIARDGEGATKLIEVHVQQAKTTKQAQLAARTISRSPLVKTAIFGADANWGRIACAVGYAGVNLDLEKLSIQLGSVILFKNGLPQLIDNNLVGQLLLEKTVVISVCLGVGHAEAIAWGCDLTYDYVKINASYGT